ncbi:MAG TPA: DUF4406 domain-containing protein [Anaerovoracaceae bacterium]|nr:DUF4406 domain-containing protein [Anaerovoracaceae bacterium]
MGIDKFNSEGYYDPTPYEAFKSIEKSTKQYLPLVYIASPFTGDIEKNIERTRGYCRLAVNKGCIPLAPHLLYPQFMDDDDKKQRELGLRFALILLGKCDELWVFGEHVSSGMAQEITKAKERDMPIRYFNYKCEEVSG